LHYLKLPCSLCGLYTPRRLEVPEDSSNPNQSRGLQVINKRQNIMEIYVGNLPWSVNDQDLADMFKEFGTVDRASVIVERPSGRSKGFGFVTMNDNSDASKAIEALNGSDMGGRPLKVNEARPKE